MKKTKYMVSLGLAFSETGDMNRLREKALQGWHLKKLTSFGYLLEKGNSKDVVYTIDYRLLSKEDKLEYFDMFALSGWEHVCSEYNMHIFKAPKGTKPIYSDVETTKDKYSRLINPIQKLTMMCLVTLGVLFIIKRNASGIIQTLSGWGASVSFILLVPLVMTLIAAYFHKWKKTYMKKGEK